MIKANAHKYSVSAMCRVLQVNRSTYYYEAKEKTDDSELTSEITDIFKASRNNYGTRKIKKELEKSGKQVSRRRIGRIVVLNVTALVVSKDKNEEERKEIENELLSYVCKSMINQVNKFRISFYANTDESVSFLRMFELLGFEKEAELKNEYKKKSLFLYSLFK